MNIQLLKEALKKQLGSQTTSQPSQAGDTMLVSPPLNSTERSESLPASILDNQATLDRAPTISSKTRPNSTFPIQTSIRIPEIAGVPPETVRSVLMSLQHDIKLVTRRSNFFKLLIPYQKVTAVGMRPMATGVGFNADEIVVERSSFSGFLRFTDKLPTRVVENAIIEIVAPVIKEGDLKWKGVYDGGTISFNMGDSAFKDLVFKREVNFSSGDSICCVLNVERNVDDLGEEVVIGYTVPLVHSKIDASGERRALDIKRPKPRTKEAPDQGVLFQADVEGGFSEEWGSW